MVAHTDPLITRLSRLFFESILSLVLDGMRMAEDVLDILQLCKDRPEEWRLHVGVLRGTHKIIEAKNLPTDPLAEFFTTRSGLTVSNGFIERILVPAIAMKYTEAATVGKPFDLPKNMVDAKIREELGENHLCKNARAFCRYLKNTLEGQWGGVEGDLLTNGNATTWYVRGSSGEVFKVFTLCLGHDGSWRVDAVKIRDGVEWAAGCRAFPCNE